MSEQLFEFFSDASQPDEEFMSKALVVYSTMAVTYGHSPEQEVDPDLVWSEVAAGMQAWDRFDIDFDKAVYSLAGLLD
jgi:hypothetical protein